MSTTWPRSANGGMMSPHSSNMSGAVPATMEATSLLIQSSGVGCSVTDLTLAPPADSRKFGSTLAVLAIQKSEADICQRRSVAPLPWIVKEGRGVGEGVAPPAAACGAGVFVGAAAAAAGLVASAAAGLVASAGLA